MARNKHALLDGPVRDKLSPQEKVIAGKTILRGAPLALFGAAGGGAGLVANALRGAGSGAVFEGARRAISGPSNPANPDDTVLNAALDGGLAGGLFGAGLGAAGRVIGSGARAIAELPGVRRLGQTISRYLPRFSTPPSAPTAAPSRAAKVVGDAFRGGVQGAGLGGGVGFVFGDDTGDTSLQGRLRGAKQNASVYGLGGLVGGGLVGAVGRNIPASWGAKLSKNYPRLASALGIGASETAGGASTGVAERLFQNPAPAAGISPATPAQANTAGILNATTSTAPPTVTRGTRPQPPTRHAPQHSYGSATPAGATPPRTPAFSNTQVANRAREIARKSPFSGAVGRGNFTDDVAAGRFITRNPRFAEAARTSLQARAQPMAGPSVPPPVVAGYRRVPNGPR